MPNVYLKKSQYDEIVKTGNDVAKFVEEAIEIALKRKGGK